MSGMEIPILIAATTAATGLSVYGQQMAGREADASARFEADQLERQAKQTRQAAGQDEASRRRDLESSLETIQVMRSGRGVSLDSPTGMAILTGATAGAERDIGIAKSNAMAKADNAELAAEMTRRKGKSSLLAADIASLTTIASGVGKVATAGRYPMAK